MLNEFKEFIAKGNVMDLAVGVIIGAAFQKIVDSLVGEIVMPVVGLLLGGTGALRNARAGQGGRSSGVRLRSVHHPGRAVPHPRLGGLPDGEGGQPHAAVGVLRISRHRAPHG